MTSTQPLQQFGPEFGKELTPEVRAVRNRLNCTRDAVSGTEKAIFGIPRHLRVPTANLFNSGYADYKVISERHHARASEITTGHEVEIVAVAPETRETILDQAAEFDPKAVDLLAEAMLADDAKAPQVASLADTEVITPEAQEYELQAMIEQELSKKASQAAVTTKEANAHLAEITQ